MYHFLFVALLYFSMFIIIVVGVRHRIQRWQGMVPIERSYPPLHPHSSYRGGIPLVVHQTMPRRGLPDLMATQLVAHNQKQAPEFSFRFYDDDDMLSIIEKNFPSQILRAYHRINPAYGACRSDFARYCILYVYGGIYLDIKSEVRRSPLSLIRQHASRDHPLFLGAHWKHARYHKDVLGNDRGEVVNWMFLVTPHHPLLEKLITTIASRILRGQENGVGKRFVLDLTGPIALTRVLLLNHDDDVVITDKLHQYFKYNSERCGWRDCRSLFYQTLGNKAYDDLGDNVSVLLP